MYEGTCMHINLGVRGFVVTVMDCCVIGMIIITFCESHFKEIKLNVIVYTYVVKGQTHLHI